MSLTSAHARFLMNCWDGEMLVTHFDAPTGSWIFIGIHSSKLGPASGGTRLMEYPNPAAALEDCLRLSRAMTLKFALPNFPRGGGKAVIATPGKLSADERTGLLLRYGRKLKQLYGLFFTGPDVGTSSADMDLLHTVAAPFIFARSVEHGGAGSSSELTADGVFHAIKATLAHLDGTDTLADRTILVQGLGSVGKRLVRLLLAENAKLIVTDINPACLGEFTAHPRVTAIGAAEVIGTSCDVYSPCALGGVLSHETVPRLNCRAVVGAANNQLVGDEAELLLQARGIVYAPDFAVNIGGALGITGIEALGWSPEHAAREVTKVGATITGILALAEAEKITPLAAATRIALGHLNSTHSS